jgi:hypothetical protein
LVIAVRCARASFSVRGTVGAYSVLDEVPSDHCGLMTVAVKMSSKSRAAKRMPASGRWSIRHPRTVPMASRKSRKYVSTSSSDRASDGAEIDTDAIFRMPTARLPATLTTTTRSLTPPIKRVGDSSPDWTSKRRAVSVLVVRRITKSANDLESVITRGRFNCAHANVAADTNRSFSDTDSALCENSLPCSADTSISVRCVRTTKFRSAATAKV